MILAPDIYQRLRLPQKVILDLHQILYLYEKYHIYLIFVTYNVIRTARSNMF